MKEVVEQFEEVINESLGEFEHAAWTGLWADKRVWELYIGFLYGHPIWTRSEQRSVEDDFRSLALIWFEGTWDGQDHDAADAAMDAMRELVTQDPSALSRPINILSESNASLENDAPWEFLMDFMVYGQSSSVFGKWYSAFEKKDGSGNMDSDLATRFENKAGAKCKLSSYEEVDIMERCRYHYHMVVGEPCYLDK